MSRTFRNRHSAPAHVVVRDDGLPYTAHCYNRCVAHANYRANACTCWSQPPFRDSYLSKEKKEDRKEHQRKYRAQVRNAMSHEDWEEIPRFTRTGGWLSW